MKDDGILIWYLEAWNKYNKKNILIQMTRSEFSKYKQITLNIGSLKDTGD